MSTRPYKRPPRNSADAVRVLVGEAVWLSTTAPIELGMLTASKPFGDVMGNSADDEAMSRRVETVVRVLQARLGAAVDPVLIRTEVEVEFARYASARVHDFVPILVEHQVQARLRGRP